MRIRGAIQIKLYFWVWEVPLGYNSVYYDGWNNSINIGFFCLCWLTPPLIGDKF
jgi:hypothetical protein